MTIKKQKNKKIDNKTKDYTFVICAAGQGKRLRPYTNKTSKAMIKIGRKTIIEHILESISSCGAYEVIIIVGYKKDSIIKKIGKKYKNCKVSFVYNKDYKISDNLYSLLLTRDMFNKGMIFLNGDTIMNKEIIAKTINSKYANGVVIDFEAKIDTDAMRIYGKNNKLVRIGKRIKGKAHGSAFGIYKLSAKATKEYFKIASIFFKNGPRRAGFVVPLRKMQAYVPIYLIPSPNSRWLEIDNEEDYKYAIKNIKNVV